MKGLDIARSFFEEWGLPYLRAEYPHVAPRVAAVVCGRSQSLGHDDELSQDHDWGPQFALVLTGQDMFRHGRWLSKRMNEAAPREWQGARLESGASVEVSSLNKWFRSLVNVDRPPSTAVDWYRATREDNLCMLKRATVFHDPLGEWSTRREAFASYPDPVWIWRACDELYRVWHFGQYNFLDRLVHRGDPVAMTVALGQFTQGVMSLAMVLNREFCPFWKWLAAEFRRLSGVEELDGLLIRLGQTSATEERRQLVADICDDMHRRVVDAHGVDSKPTSHPHALWCDRQELLRKTPKP